MKYYADTSKNKFIIGNSNIKIAIYVYGFIQYINGKYVNIESYIGKDNVWVSMNSLTLYDYGDIPSTVGGYSLEANNTSYTKAYFNSDNIYIWRRYGVGGSFIARATTQNIIDLSSYKTLFIEAITYGNCSIQILKTNGSTVLKSLNITDGDKATKKIYQVDISSIKEDCKVRLDTYENGNKDSIWYIYKIWAE